MSNEPNQNSSGKKRFNEMIKKIDDILQLDELFSQLDTSFQHHSFPIQTTETKNEYIIRAEVHHYEPKDINVELFEDFIKISVEDSQFYEAKDDNQDYVFQQENIRVSERIVPLPDGCNKDQTTAEYNEGILKIRIQK